MNRTMELLEIDGRRERYQQGYAVALGAWVFAWDKGQEECHQGRYQGFRDNQYWVDGVDYDYISITSVEVG